MGIYTGATLEGNEKEKALNVIRSEVKCKLS